MHNACFDTTATLTMDPASHALPSHTHHLPLGPRDQGHQAVPRVRSQKGRKVLVGGPFMHRRMEQGDSRTCISPDD